MQMILPPMGHRCTPIQCGIIMGVRFGSRGALSYVVTSHVSMGAFLLTDYLFSLHVGLQHHGWDEVFMLLGAPFTLPLMWLYQEPPAKPAAFDRGSHLHFQLHRS